MVNEMFEAKLYWGINSSLHYQILANQNNYVLLLLKSDFGYGSFLKTSKRKALQLYPAIFWICDPRISSHHVARRRAVRKGKDDMCEAREQLSACPIQISTSTALSVLPSPSADPWMSYSGIPHEANRHPSDFPRATESRLQIPPATIPAIANTQSAFAHFPVGIYCRLR